MATKTKQTLNAELRASRARVKRFRESIMQQCAAKERVRRHAAEWVSSIRNRVAELKEQVGAVYRAVKTPGSVLSLVLDAQDLADLNCDLDSADSNASSLTILGVDLPVPDLVMYERYLLENEFPLAGEGVKIMAKSVAEKMSATGDI